MRVAFTQSVKATLKGGTFENTTPHSDPLEQRISAELWRWAFSDAAARDEMISQQKQFAGDLEFYICGLLDIIPQAQAPGLWCDGVIDLEITKLNRTTFRIIGAAYLTRNNACWLAAFELEFYFEKRRDGVAQKLIFRIHPVCAPNDSQHRHDRRTELLANRPRQDRDWAIAVTITPEVA